MTCNECAHFLTHCKWLLSRKGQETKCDWIPSRFEPANPIDREKPEIQPGQKLCDGCWAVDDRGLGWLYLSFKSLKSVQLCMACQIEQADKFIKMQRMGL